MSIGRHALVIGKFYPPHAGHHALIRRAATEGAQVTVVVMAATGDSISLADRVSWLQIEHVRDPSVTIVGIPCDVPTDLDDAQVWAAQVATMRAALATVTAVPVDVVVSSEAYGEQLATWFDARHVLMDADRVGVPISGTAIRQDLARHWHLLAPATRGGLAVRVVVVGAESTGTTTLARALTAHYRDRGGAWECTAYVPEFGREYSATKWADLQRMNDKPATGAAATVALTVDDMTWTRAEFDLIAATQTRLEQDAACAGSPVLICDTDAFATAIWERRYLPQDPRPLPSWATTDLPPRDIYLLTDHVGVAWEDDGLREGDLGVRAAMTGWFAAALTAADRSWVLMTGSPEQRLRIALQITDRLLVQRASLAAPIG